MKKIYAILLAAALCFGLSGCSRDIYKTDTPTEASAAVTEDMPPAPPAVTTDENGSYTAGELYGSYLTMYIGHTPIEYQTLPQMAVFNSYDDIEDYYRLTSADRLYGMKLVLALASFNDEFLAENDVMLLLINEPSCYINHTAEPVEISDSEVKISLTRHSPENAPEQDTQYTLIFTAPKGSFDGIVGKKLSVDISEVIDRENNEAFDAERFRLYYPDFTTFCYRADALTEDPERVIDALQSYEELVYFYINYKDEYDLDAEFYNMVGTLYNWEVFERYALIAAIVPCSEAIEPETSDLFVNNLELWMSIDAYEVQSGEAPEACYLLLTAVERRYLNGVNLDALYISIE